MQQAYPTALSHCFAACANWLDSCNEQVVRSPQWHTTTKQPDRLPLRPLKSNRKTHRGRPENGSLDAAGLHASPIVIGAIVIGAIVIGAHTKT